MSRALGFVVVALLGAASASVCADEASDDPVPGPCVRVETVAVAPPKTPLAAQTEVHMRCFGVLDEPRETDADFLIADGRLRLVELLGAGVTDWARAAADGEGSALADYTVYRDDGIVLHDARRRAWLIAADDIRSYAFLQEDPFETPFEQAEPAPPVLPVPGSASGWPSAVRRASTVMPSPMTAGVGAALAAKRSRRRHQPATRPARRSSAFRESATTAP